MMRKSLLRSATSLLATFAFVACVTGASVPPIAAAQASAAAAAPVAQPTVADAAAFVAAAETDLRTLSEEQNRTSWVFNNFITYDTEWLNERSDAHATEVGVRLASGAARFQHVPNLPLDVARKLLLLRLGLTLPAPQTPGAAQRLSALTTHLASIYSSSKIEYQGHQVPLDDLESLMGTERDPARLQEMWTKWHAIATPMTHDYAQMVEIANQGARDLGFADVGQMWLSNYDMPPDQMYQEVDRLWNQVKPLYAQLHCYVRGRLNAHYGDAVQPNHGPIRADLLGNMWAQGWGPIYDLVAPEHITATGYDLTTQLNAQHYDANKLVHTGEHFYISLGMPPLPSTFWERSLFTRPADRDVVCHASAWDLDNANDLRVKMCIHIDADYFQTVHHELGHNYYQRAYKDQPFLFENGAHDGFHESIGDFIALNAATPNYLAQIGVIRQNQIPPPSADLGLLMNMALDKVAFMPFAYSVDKWRWDVFAGRITPAQYNEAWWRIRRQNQGIAPPGPRPADAFDPGAKFHVANNVPYLRYFLAYVLEFQFYKSACEQAHWRGPLHRCTIYGNTQVGQRFYRMLQMGASHPWPDALQAFTGTRRMDASAMVAYFQPLMVWLQQQNRTQHCGWDA